MSIHSKYKMFGNGIIEKKILREALNILIYYHVKYYLEKRSFSDGVSSQEKSWFQIIQEHLETQISDEEFKLKQKTYTHNPPHTKKHFITENYLKNILKIIVI